jgi:hypothetical protein
MSHVAPHRVRRTSSSGATLAAVLAATAATAYADHHEAQWSLRPLVGVAALPDEGAKARMAPLAGLDVGFGYGVSNELNLGGEVISFASAEARFPEMGLLDGGAPFVAPLKRRTVSTVLLLGPTWRFGVAWTPVVSLGLGGGVRSRSAGTFVDSGYTPDNKQPATHLDLAASARVGLERRVNRRWTIGAYAAAMANWGPASPFLPAVNVTLGLSYVNYPLWW